MWHIHANIRHSFNTRHSFNIEKGSTKSIITVVINSKGDNNTGIFI